MAHFNLDDYETVAARVMRLKSEHQDSRILTEVIKLDNERGEVLAKASIYLGEVLAGSDFAYGVASTYPQSMRKFYVEDTITSAIGRAISLVIPTDKKPTREDMQKVQQHEQTKSLIADTKAKMAQTSGEYVPVPKEDDPWTIRTAEPVQTMEGATKLLKEVLGAKTQEDIPSCKHGQMVWKTGKKNNKPWGCFSCNEMPRLNPCDPVWYVIDKETGTWKPQVKW